MLRDKFNIDRLKIYDTNLFPKVSREEFLKENHLYLLSLFLEPYEKYIRFTEDYLEKQANDLQERHLIECNDDNGSWLKSEEYASKMIEIDSEFAQRFREGIIVQLYSFLERSIIGSCESYYSNRELSDYEEIEISKIGVMDSVKSFLKNKVSIEINRINDEMNFFTNLGTLRNRIVHNSTSTFSDDEKNINRLRALSKNRFQMIKRDDFTTTYSLYFDNPDFSFEIIEKIKSLYVKLGENGVYY